MPDLIQRTALYRFFDAKGNLLYVGIAKDPKRRWRQHAIDSSDTWWPDVHRKEVEWHESRAEAEEAEKRAIRTEGPSYNTAHTATGIERRPGWVKPAPAPSARAEAARHSQQQRGISFSMRSRSAKTSMPDLVAQTLRDEISAGQHTPDVRLPRVADLAKRFGISRPTVSLGLQILKDEGILESRPGVGTFVIRAPAR
jgi:excinuclease UvrABC nuclease subunit